MEDSLFSIFFVRFQIFVSFLSFLSFFPHLGVLFFIGPGKTMMHLTRKPVGIGTALRSRKANRFLSFWSYTMLITWEFLGFCSRNIKTQQKSHLNRDFLSRQEPRSSFQFETRNRNSTRNYFRRFLNNTSLTVHQKVGILTRQSLNFLGFWKHF